MKDKGLELPDIILNAIVDGVVEDSELQDIFKNPDVEFIHKAHFNCSGPYGFYSIESLLPSDRCEFHKKFIEDYGEHPDSEWYKEPLEEMVEKYAQDLTGDDYYKMIRAVTVFYLKDNQEYYQKNCNQICGCVAQALWPALHFQLEKDYPNKGYISTIIGVIKPDKDKVTHVDCAVWDPTDRA